MKIERVAIIKDGSVADELRLLKGLEPDPMFRPRDSVVPYIEELINGLSEKKLMIFGRTEKNDSFTHGTITAHSIDSTSNESCLPVRLFKRIRADRRIKYKIKRFNPDLIISFGIYNQQPFLYKLSRDVGSVFLPIIVQSWIEPGCKIRKCLWRKAVKVIKKKNIPSIFVRGHYLADHLNKQFGLPQEKITIYYPRYDKKLYRQDNSRNPFDNRCYNLLFVGRLESDKGIEILPDLLDKLSQEIPELKFSIVGNGSREKWLEEKLLIIDKEQKHWEMVGYVEPLQIFDYFLNCNVYLMPTQREGFGKTAFEAGLCGAPIVASRVDNLEYMFDDRVDGMLIEWNDIDGFAKAILELYNDRDFAETIGRKISTKFRNIKMQTLTESLKELILNIEKKNK